MAPSTILSPFLALFLILLTITSPKYFYNVTANSFILKEATVDDLQLAFKENRLTSRQVVEFYLGEIRRLNPVLKGVLEVNLDAFYLADKADQERKAKAPVSLSSRLHSIPILVKDNISTKDGMNTTAGSFALLGSIVPRDAGVVSKLRKAGAIILEKASLSEWSYFRSDQAPSGWSARGGQGMRERSILCPSSWNSVVGIKPTIGLTSRAGVVPISPRQDTVGPICRTVSDAVHVLDVIIGIDHNDNATFETSKYIPKGGYAQFLKHDGLKGKRIGIVRKPFFDFGNNTFLTQTCEQHFKTLRKRGTILIDHLEIANIQEILRNSSGEHTAFLAEFKIYLNAYLKELVASPVRSLSDVIAFNNKNSKLENEEYGQGTFLRAQRINGIGELEKAALSNLERLANNGLQKVTMKNKLDALVAAGGVATPYPLLPQVLATGGFPGIIVPVGYIDTVPFDVCFGRLKGSEPKLIEIAFAFEQATKHRKPPSL